MGTGHVTKSYGLRNDAARTVPVPLSPIPTADSAIHGKWRSAAIYPVIRRLLFQMDAEDAHRLALKVLHQMGSRPALARAAYARWGQHAHAFRDRLGSQRWGLNFSGPVGLAAGFDKDGIVLAGLTALGFHFIEAGTVTPRPQPGNPRPRLFRLPPHRALVNRMGFNNDGAAAMRRHMEAFIARRDNPSSGLSLPAIPVGINIGKNKDTPVERTVDDYILGLRTVWPFGDYYVVNLSSPNTPGLRDLQTGAFVRELLSTMQEELQRLAGQPGEAGEPGAAESPSSVKPLLLKIAPDLQEHHLEAILEAALDTNLSGIIVANTWPHPDGGLSGRPLKQWGDRLVAAVYRRVGNRLPIIGVGGIFTAEDVYTRIKAGAVLTQLYTGFIYEGPGLIAAITRRLVQLLERDGLRHIDEAVGVEADQYPEPWAAGDIAPAGDVLRPVSAQR